MKPAIIVLWIIWVFLFLAWPTDMLVAVLHEPGEPSESNRDFFGLLGFIGFIELGLTFFVRWFLLRFIVHPKRVRVSSLWAVVTFVVASLTIWGLTKSVEIYGLLIFFASESIALYLAFWVPSVVVMLIHCPYFLDPRRATMNQAEEDTESSV